MDLHGLAVLVARQPAHARRRRQLRARTAGALRGSPARAGPRGRRDPDPARPHGPARGSLRYRFPRALALTDTWTLGGLRLANRLVLAPLAGIGNWFVRLQARRYGAGLVISEMVSSFGLAYGNERTVREFLRIHPDEHPVSIQLFGHDAAVMREAAAMVGRRRRRPDRPQHGLPGAQGLQDRRRRRAARRPRPGGRASRERRARAAACP